MANLINTRNIGTDDKRVQMSNSYFARGFTVSSAWTTLRLAFRYCFTDLGSNPGSTPQFAFGFCSGTTNIFGDATTDHFVGWKTTHVTWIRDVASFFAYYDNDGVGISVQPFKRIGTTDTNGSGIQSPNRLTLGITTTRNVMYCDLVKGSPNYTLKLFARNTWTYADVSKATFDAQALLVSPTVANHGQLTDRTLAVDEATNGTLNCVNFSWDRTDFLLEISDISVVRLA